MEPPLHESFLCLYNMRCLKIVGKLKLWKRNFKDVFASKLGKFSCSKHTCACAHMCGRCFKSSTVKKNQFFDFPPFISWPSLFFLWLRGSLSSYLLCLNVYFTLRVTFLLHFLGGGSNGLCPLAFFPGSQSTHQVPLPPCLPLPSFARITVSPPWTRSVFQPRIGREAAL